MTGSYARTQHRGLAAPPAIGRAVVRFDRGDRDRGTNGPPHASRDFVAAHGAAHAHQPHSVAAGRRLATGETPPEVVWAAPAAAMPTLDVIAVRTRQGPREARYVHRAGRAEPARRHMSRVFGHACHVEAVSAAAGPRDGVGPREGPPADRVRPARARFDALFPGALDGGNVPPEYL